MAKKRRGPKCKICCLKPECGITVAYIWGGPGLGYVWRVFVRYKGAVSATLTDYDGSAFTFPSFTGNIDIPATTNCYPPRFILSITGASGEVKECVWNNSNCCCESVPLACNEYRVPMSRGTNALQPSMLITVAGVATMPGVPCSVHGFYNGSYLVPFGSRFSKADEIACTLPSGFVVYYSRRITVDWAREPCIGTFNSEPTNPPEYCGYDGSQLYRQLFYARVQAESAVSLSIGAGSRMHIWSAAKVNLADDYSFKNCNIYHPPCYALSNQRICTWTPQATAPPTVSCSGNFFEVCCGGAPDSACPTCARQCGGPADFRGTTLSCAVVP
jgi:hypothetical protein